MKIRLNKRKGTISFRAESDTEGVDLKNVVLNFAESDQTIGGGVANNLVDEGYRLAGRKDAATFTELTLSKPALPAKRVRKAAKR